MRVTKVHINALAVTGVLFLIALGLFATLWRNELEEVEFQSTLMLVAAIVYGLVHVAKTFTKMPEEGEPRQ